MECKPLMGHEARTDASPERREELLRLFVQHRVMLSGFLFSLVEDWELVDEALQETAVFLCSRWEEFVPGTNFGAWARTVARMRCLEALHRRRRGSGLSLDPRSVDVAGSIRSEEWEEHGEFSAQQKEALSKCLKALSFPYSQVIEMRYVQRQPCERIAERLGKRVDAVYKALSRVRERLKECVERRMAREV